MGAHDPAAVLAALARYPPLGDDLPRVAAVGGFVRDVWLGREPRELDLVVEGDVGALAGRLGGEVTVHEAFGTATVMTAHGQIDLAMARRERYPAPGALPLVEPASIEADLRRRDFTVNAFAVTIADGAVLDVPDAHGDLDARRLRVLHDASFRDDPTRLLRLARYAERLSFEVEERTAALARDAGFETLSGGRLGGELRLALAEPEPVAVLERVAGVLPIVVDRRLIAAALELAPPDADRPMLVLAAVAGDDAWLDGLELTARERALVRACQTLRTPADTTPSALWRAWHAAPAEAVALAGARGGADAARRWLDGLHAVRLEIGGDDLIAAGIAEGPEIGRRLERTLAHRLDGALPAGRDAELADALAGDPPAERSRR